MKKGRNQIQLINEVLEVQEYLAGKNINKKSIYRICYLIAKWYAQQGLTHLEIREKIFEWGKTNNIYIEYNVNNIIYQALSNKNRLKEDSNIKINENDIQEITRRFDSKNNRIVALALLCYAKAFADRNGEFSISLAALANWAEINHGNISGRILSELIDFNYVQKVSTTKPIFTWNKSIKTKAAHLKICVPLHNNGKYQLKDNKILDLYNSIFSEN